MTPERVMTVVKCLLFAIEAGTKGRKTDIPGVACQYGKVYKLTRDECEEVVDKTLRELVTLTGGSYGTRIRRKNNASSV